MIRLIGLFAAAGLALGAGACGEVKSNAPDGGAGGPDASNTDGGAGNADAAPDAQTSGPVSVHVLSLDYDGLPAPGATVLFYGPDGTLADRMLTDNNGDATAELDAGGFITVVRLRANDTHLTTVAGVKPNETITVGRPENASSTNEGTTRVILPTFNNATYYSVDVGCGYGSGQTTAFNVNLYGCGGGTGDIVATTSVNNNTYYLGMNGVSLVPNGAIDLGSQQWTYLNPTGFTLSLTTVPAGLSYMSGRRSSFSEDGELYSDYASSVQNPPAGSAAFEMAYPAGIGSGTLVQVFLERQFGNNPSYQRLTEKAASVSSSYGIDLSSSMLPWVSKPVFAGNDLSWTGGAGGDAILLDLWMNTQTGTFTYANWRVILPPGATEFTLPALPNDLQNRWTAPDATYNGDTTIIELGPVAGYDGFRTDMEPYSYQVFWGMDQLLADAPETTAAISTTFQGD